jgi:hypothetical protein
MFMIHRQLDDEESSYCKVYSLTDMISRAALPPIHTQAQPVDYLDKDAVWARTDRCWKFRAMDRRMCLEADPKVHI